MPGRDDFLGLLGLPAEALEAIFQLSDRAAKLRREAVQVDAMIRSLARRHLGMKARYRVCRKEDCQVPRRTGRYGYCSRHEHLASEQEIRKWDEDTKRATERLARGRREYFDRR